MEYMVIGITIIVMLIILKYALDIKIKNIKKLKEIGYDKKLNEITNKLPENKEICKKILKKLNNESVEIKEDSENKTSLYIVLSNSILIANIKDTFTRVQTIAHECLHSVQNKRILMFNFFFSNIYLVYFLAIIILSILKLNQFKTENLFILTFISFIYSIVRSYLEMDAMTKAKPLAKEYMEDEGVLSKGELKNVLDNYEVINNIAIKLTNYILILKSSIKILLYLVAVVLF